MRDGVTTPAGQAYSVLHTWLAGTPRPSCQVDKGLYTCVVRGVGETRRIVWRERGTSRLRAMPGETRLEYLAGEPRRLGAGNLVRVGQSPVAIVEPRRS